LGYFDETADRRAMRYSFFPRGDKFRSQRSRKINGKKYSQTALFILIMLKSCRSTSVKAEHASISTTRNEIGRVLVGADGCQEAGSDLSAVILWIKTDGWI